jgi:hypothetical protein
MNFRNFYLFLILFAIALIAECQANTKKFGNDKPIFEIFKDMGIEDNTELSRKQLQTLFYRLITKDKEVLNNQHFYKSVSDKIVSRIPDKILTTDIVDYLDQKYLFQAIEEVVREQYGEEYVPKIREAFSSLLQDDKNSNEEEEILNKDEETLNNEETSANDENNVKNSEVTSEQESNENNMKQDSSDLNQNIKNNRNEDL